MSFTPWRHWGWCHPGRKLTVSPLSPLKKTGDLFCHRYKVMTFLAVVSSQLHDSHLLTSCCPVFFVNSATIVFIRVSLPWMLSPGAIRPLLVKPLGLLIYYKHWSLLSQCYFFTFRIFVVKKRISARIQSVLFRRQMHLS